MNEEIDSDAIDYDSIDQLLTDNRTRWTYHVVREVDDKNLESTLTSYGCLGWELASIQPDVHMNYVSSQDSLYNLMGKNYYTVVFRCPYWVEQTEQTDE